MTFYHGCNGHYRGQNPCEQIFCLPLAPAAKAIFIPVTAAGFFALRTVVYIFIFKTVPETAKPHPFSNTTVRAAEQSCNRCTSNSRTAQNQVANTYIHHIVRKLLLRTYNQHRFRLHNVLMGILAMCVESSRVSDTSIFQ